MKPVTAVLLLLGIVAACLAASITLVLVRPTAPALPGRVIVVPVNPPQDGSGEVTVIAHGGIRYLVPIDNMPMVLKP